jgi:hypothetical protein
LGDVTALASVVASAGPVLLVAFYAMRQGPDVIEEATVADYVVDVPAHWRWVFVEPVRWVLALGGHVQFDDTPRSGWEDKTWADAPKKQKKIAPGQIRALVLSRDFAQGGDFGFILRTPASFILAVCPLVPGVGETFGDLALAAAVVLLMFNLNLLLTYCAQVGAVRYSAAVRKRSDVSADVGRWNYPWRVVRAASLSGIGGIAVSVWIAGVLVVG